MPNYRVPCEWKMYGFVNVVAKSPEEAARIATEECPLPDDAEYLSDSFEAHVDEVEEVK
jgi:hypothetical protein